MGGTQTILNIMNGINIIIITKQKSKNNNSHIIMFTIVRGSPKHYKHYTHYKNKKEQETQQYYNVYNVREGAQTL